MKLFDSSTPGFGKYVPFVGGVFFVLVLCVAVYSIVKPDMTPPPNYWNPNDHGNVSVPSPSSSTSEVAGAGGTAGDSGSGGSSGSGGVSGNAGNSGTSSVGGSAGSAGKTAPKSSK